MCILVTFTLSSLIICSLQHFKRCVFAEKSAYSVVLSAAAFIGMVFLTLALNMITSVNGISFSIEYGFWGCMLPVFPAIADMRGIEGAGEGLALQSRYVRLAFFAAGLVILCVFSGTYVQFFSLIALVPLALYSGERGKWNLKYFFYVFYPAHLALFYLIAYFI